MLMEALFVWVMIFAACELATAPSVVSVYGGAGALILILCAWLVRSDLDLLAILIAATYGSVLVCLSLAQTHMDGFPGLAAQHPARAPLLASLGAGALFALTSGAVSANGPASALFVDLVGGQGDWLEQVIGAFHIFFYKACVLEAALLNIFLLLALVASLSIMGICGEAALGRQSAPANGASRVRLVRSFRRQVRRKNSSRPRAARR